MFDENEAKRQTFRKPLDRKLDINPIYEQLYKNELVEYMKNIKIGIESDKIDINTIDKFKEDWSRGIFSNIESILKSYDISYFKDIFKDKPIIVIGAGPSLNKNVHLLKEIEGKACIICAFSAARVLKNNNITPDFLVSVDSKQYGLEEYEANIPLIYSREANKDLLKNHKSKKVIYISEWEIFLRDILEKDDEAPAISMSGTVSSFSAAAAYYFGASEIILLGQDFSWTEDKAHADGTVHKIEECYKAYHGKQIKEKDIYGNTVYTNRAFYDFKVWFDNFSKSIFATKIIQATEGGLPIENAETLTFRQAIDKYCKDKYCDVKEILNSKYESSKIIEEETDREKVFEKIKIFYKETKDMKKTAKE
ncbi:MAG: DUF115 domain-containing protein, partial [Eubacteriales bacterium]|nr:DUF115 domain-containing protein [Eubacteriales bacterium]